MGTVIHLTEEKLYNIIKETLKNVLNRKRLIKEIKYFHPSGEPLPNGSFYQKGNFLNECRRNKDSFILSEDIHSKQYGLKDYRGGIIVFSTDVNAVVLHKNGFMNKLKQFLTTFLQRWHKDKKIHGIINKFNDEVNKETNDWIGAYSLGNFFKGKYVGDNGEMFNDKSIAIEINGLSSKGLMRLAEYISQDFMQETVLVKDLNTNKIYLANGKKYEGSEEDLKNKLNNEINLKC